MQKITIKKKKMKGQYGETEFKKNGDIKISINTKKYHKNKPFRKTQTPNQAMADTIYHELTHAKHPKMHEKTVRKVTARKMKSISESEVRRLLKKLK